MTSAELIAHLKDIDPSGNMIIVEYDGCDNFCDIMPEFVQTKEMYMEEGRRNMNTYYAEHYKGLEPITVIVI